MPLGTIGRAGDQSGVHVSPMATAIRSSLICLGLLAGIASGQSASTRPRTVRVVVTDSTGKPIADARVSAAGGDHGARTDSAGVAILPDLPAGLQQFSVQRLGYRSLDFAVTAVADTSVKVWLSELPVLVDGIVVSAVSPAFAGFEQRRKLGVGVFITPEMIRNSRATRSSDLFRQVSQVHMVQTTSGEGVRFATSLTSISKVSQITWGISADVCAPMIFIDGQRAPSLEVDDIALVDVLAIEVYRGSAITPPQFVTPGAIQCGAIVIWTRRR